LFIFANGIGEKSGFNDALAYYFALNQRDVGNLIWNSSIYEAEGKAVKKVISQSDDNATYPRFGVAAFLYVREGLQFSYVHPLG
jgi:hypothetical protein